MAEGEYTALDHGLTNAFGFSAADWTSDELSRALLTVVLSVDYQIADGSLEIDAGRTSYVDKNEDALTVIFATTDGGMIGIIYDASKGFAMFQSGGVYDQELIETTMPISCESFYSNAPEYLDMVVSILQGALSQ